ncbi:response regulator transcription factor [Legionella shakespearei]|uniref:Sigma 54-dependent response regulator n=1 Tax=Legionella shakespearei DSM 23087 TaxID=1122169 RepID=A0A0W0YHU4_9GAMM|nr:response regulator [Legionella shakespearei]KTD56469.1 sigma 54-dependent response regulator [Legionella shakespearei DSM 23087]
MTKSNQTVFIVDDETEVRDALRCLFESIQLPVETYETAALFLEKYPNASQGCLITDVRLSGMSGLELLEQLNTQNSSLPVIIITGYGDIHMAVRAMKAGAKDFLLKPLNDQSLLETVQNCMSQSEDLSSLELINERINSLSSRELNIIDLILDGKLTKEIAYELSVSISTVEAHRASIMQKMHARNLAQLIKLYLQAKFARGYPYNSQG